ncbi:hypothetical protein CNMCM8980_010367 [Aspergillus fumigatiaffinis]|uniref:O-methyltransferase n=1 Tax=Aspergillus fumigatiaffinis TaxID=340414 RepID=A0A8H4HG60_9EURO|nr:hypothetical protein CNMCM5878_008329 [Aspergillus fumigatiaffinis]KAF4244031.1 hypothetical protein CNMCM8980_010367 [Aspergillus fumigatiaffinis]KAF4245013.1 hypothetical protein CNMCM6805_006446 [Aspergillus fumigatiaffinis]
MGSIENNIDAIQKELDEVVNATNTYKASDNDYTARYDLMVKATRLLQTIRGPVDMLFTNFENMASMGAIRTLLEAGVFHAMPTGGQSISAKEISAKTGMDKEMIVRLMRALTPIGPFRETGEEEYAHTPFSEIYMVPQMSAIFKVLVDEYCPPMLRNHEFLAKHNWKNTMTLTDNPYTHVHNCTGQTMFDYISQFPERLSRLNDAMMAQDSALVVHGLYPFTQELGALARDDGVTIVDVGGGRGHILRQIRETEPGLKGRFILQDRPIVIEENGRELESHGIEPMAHDFFQAQPVKGALIYYVRRVFHDWPDDEVRQILVNLAAAMEEHSRILIVEFIMPEVGATMSNAYMDHTMMTFAGVERTEKNFANLLDQAGLRLVKTWRAPGVPVGVVEARLK